MTKFLVMYCYFEIKNFQKNQTNLSFFIKHGIKSADFGQLDIEYIFIINGHQCEVSIPIQDNIFILREDNCFDFEGWNNGIIYLENKFKCEINERYDYIFFINCSVLGPLIDSNSHWLLPYYNKILNEDSVICSNIINNYSSEFLPDHGLKCTSYCFLLKCDREILEILRTELITCKSKTETFINTVFGKKRSKEDCINSGEYGLTRILLKHNYRISCLLFEPFDYYNMKYNYPEFDRYNRYNGKNLPIEKMIFYKNIWRSDDYRVCLPVEYNKCIELVNKYCNYKSDTYSINYGILPCKDKGITWLNEEQDWNTKKEFYIYHGYAEEIITFPIQKENRNIAIYINKNDIIKDYTIQGIKCLMETGYDIYFCHDGVINIDLPFSVNPIEDINKDLFQKYERCMIINSEYIFPVYGLEHFKNKDDTWFYSDFACEFIVNENISLPSLPSLPLDIMLLDESKEYDIPYLNYLRRFI